MVLICISLTTNAVEHVSSFVVVEHFSVCSCATHIFSSMKCLFILFVYFLIGSCFLFKLVSFELSLYTPEMSPLSLSRSVKLSPISRWRLDDVLICISLIILLTKSDLKKKKKNTKLVDVW